MVIGSIPIKKNTKVTKSTRLPLLLTPQSRVIFKLLCTFAAEISHKYVFIMARPIRETPVLKGEDAFNFEMRRLEVEHMSKEQRAENRRKLEERIANAKNKIEWCW